MSRPTFSTTGVPSASRVEGTVARGQLRTDELFYTGKINGVEADQFPFPITRADLDRGRERYNIYCTPCHDYTGTGNGMIVQRGFPEPPSYHIDRLRDAPVGHFYGVITDGFGAMYSYAARIEPADRWRIAAYIRVLQLSQNATVDAVPAADRDKLASTSAAQVTRSAGSTMNMMNSSDTTRQIIEKRQMPALILGVIGLVALVVIGHGSVQFFRSYLFAFEFCVSFPLGCLAILMIHHLTGGWWGLPIRRILEAGSRTLPLMGILFIPVFFGISKIYSWTSPGTTTRS